MTIEIGKGFLLFSTTSEIWQAACATYSNKRKNIAESFEIEGKIHELRHGDMQVTSSLNCPNFGSNLMYLKTTSGNAVQM